jgi:small multidrug resistance pump
MVGITILEIFVFGFFNNEAVTFRSVAGAGCLLAAMFLLYSPKLTQG